MSNTVETVLMLAIGVGLGWLARWGAGRGIAEARFDSKIRKQIT